MKKLLLLLIFIYGFAGEVQIANDEFNQTNGGYKYIYNNSSVSIKNGFLYLNKAKEAYKVYNIGSQYRNHKVEIKIKVNLPKRIKFKVYINDVQNKKIYSSQEIVLTSRLNSQGKIKIGLKQFDSSSYAYIDYVRIYDKTLEYQNNPRAFSLYSSDNIRGDVTMIGNSVLESYSGNCANQVTQNNRIYAVYADKDNDTTTYNSTWAKLNLPHGINSNNIVYALLYWQGRVGNNENAIKHGKSVKLKLFGMSGYQTINTIEDKFNHINGDYQGVADVTDLIKQSISNVDPTDLLQNGYHKRVWVADVYTASNGYNLYGAWSLIVVYRDSNAHLKNITLYDGYDEIHIGESNSYHLSGFLTPMRGNVNAKLMVFAGEGDVVYRDSISLTDKNGNPILLDRDFFRSSEDIDGINIIDRNPNCANTIGIDLRTRSVGTNGNPAIIGNGQTSTTITLSSGGDQYFPGVFIFSTDLYEPRVCYYIDTIKDDEDNVIYKNKHFINDIEANKEYKISFWIANMKQNPTDEDIEIARKVQLFLNTSDFNYTTSSTLIKNLNELNFSNKTDIKDSDIFEFIAPNKYNFRLGIGANGIEGGTIDVANSFLDNSKKAFIDLNGVFIFDSNQTSINLDDVFHFKAAFATTSVTINASEALPIPKCVEFNSEGGVYTPVSGNFNVVNENFTGNVDPLNIDDPKNALYTQIANKSFNIKVLALKDDYQTLDYFTGPVDIELIETPNYQPTDTDEEKIEKCKNAVTLKQQSLFFSNEKMKEISFIYPNINRDVTFRIVSFKSNICSNKGNIIQFMGCMFSNFTSKMYRCRNRCMYISNSNKAFSCMRCMFESDDMKNVICARDNFAIRPDHFNITALGTARADKNISFINIKAFDAINNILSEYNVSSIDLNITANEKNPMCINATPTYSFTFNNGNANINYIKYPEVGEINLTISEKIGNEFALIDNNDTSDEDRLISSATSNIFSVIPDHFSISNINVTNFNNSLFTYLSNDLNMSATLSAIIEAKNGSDNTTLNYTPNCYAKRVDLNITHTATTTMDNLDNILTQYSVNDKNTPISFSLDENNFTNGQAILNLKINFDRNSSKIVDPFTLTLNDINITDINETNGSNTISQNINFIYGRIFTQDISTIQNNANVNIIFQKFNGFEWIKNTLHNNKIYGDVNETFSLENINVSLNESNINGEQNLTITPNTNTRPYKVKLHLNIPIWLWYSRYGVEYQAPSNTNTNCLTHPCINILFTGKGNKNWSGVGTDEKENNVTKNTINSNIQQNTHKNNSFHRLSW